MSDDNRLLINVEHPIHELLVSLIPLLHGGDEHMLQAKGDSNAELLKAIIRHCENGISCVHTAIQAVGVCVATDIKDRPDDLATDIGWTIHLLGSLVEALDHVRSDTEYRRRSGLAAEIALEKAAASSSSPRPRGKR
jgi:hypothetical protein